VLNSLLAGVGLRAVSVAVVLVASLTFTGLLSASYHRVREAQGHRHYEIAGAMQAAGNIAGAAEEYRKALLFLPDQTDYRQSLSIALIELGRLSEAQTHLQEMALEDPTDGVVNLLLARVAERRNEPKQAVEYFRRSVYGFWPREKLPARHAARWELVKLLEEQNRTTEVVGELLQLYANAPNDLDEKARIGFLLLKYGATSDARAVFNDLTRIQPRSALPHRGYGQAYLDSGDYLAARRELQQAVRLAPDDHEAQELLKQVNTIIELDPTLPRLSARERLRRSQQLLTRVLSFTETCGTTATPETVDAARQLLTASGGDPDDLSNRILDGVGQLWKARSDRCTAEQTDRSLEAVLSRVTS
jgi:tetratricopeptide (TPR) repeat protein